MHVFDSVQTLYIYIVEIWMRKLSCLCGPCSSSEWDYFESVYWFYRWDNLSLHIDECVPSKLS
jgi:hypothetical protein